MGDAKRHLTSPPQTQRSEWGGTKSRREQLQRIRKGRGGAASAHINNALHSPLPLSSLHTRLAPCPQPATVIRLPPSPDRHTTVHWACTAQTLKTHHHTQARTPTRRAHGKTGKVEEEEGAHKHVRVLRLGLRDAEGWGSAGVQSAPGNRTERRCLRGGRGRDQRKRGGRVSSSSTTSTTIGFSPTRPWPAYPFTAPSAPRTTARPRHALRSGR